MCSDKASWELSCLLITFLFTTTKVPIFKRKAAFHASRNLTMGHCLRKLKNLYRHQTKRWKTPRGLPRNNGDREQRELWLKILTTVTEKTVLSMYVMHLIELKIKSIFWFKVKSDLADYSFIVRAGFASVYDSIFFPYKFNQLKL